MYLSFLDPNRILNKVRIILNSFKGQQEELLKILCWYLVNLTSSCGLTYQGVKSGDGCYSFLWLTEITLFRNTSSKRWLASLERWAGAPSWIYQNVEKYLLLNWSGTNRNMKIWLNMIVHLLYHQKTKVLKLTHHHITLPK